MGARLFHFPRSACQLIDSLGLSLFTAARGPEWACLFCKRGTLRMVPNSYSSPETNESKAEHRSEHLDPYWIRKSFACWLKCTSCDQRVVLIGRASFEWGWDDSTENEKIVEVCRPMSIEPLLPLFPLPPELPPLVREQLEASSDWSGPILVQQTIGSGFL
jgi:hypothetical protein